MGYVYLGQSRIASIFKELPVETLIDKLCNKSAIEILDIPEGVSTIGDYLFYNCPNLTNVIIPASVEYIGEGAFYNSDNIEVIDFNGLPPSTVGENAFPATDGTYKKEFREDWEAVIDSTNNLWNNLTMSEYVPLETIVTYSDGSTKSFLIEGELVGRSSSPYYTTQIDNVQNATEINIGKAVTSIGQYTFRGCTSLTSVTIPEGVTEIGNYVFYNCSGLTSMTIPSSVTSIGYNAFYRCLSLTSVTIPSSVTSIGNEAFRACSSLTSITIPSSVISIGNGVFWGCTGLTSVTIPSSVTSIGKWTFTYCSSLISVMIPSSVISIGYQAFSYCSSLTSITFEGNPPTSVDSSAFSTSNANLVGYYLPENAEAWEAVIVDGKWNGMTMQEYIDLENYTIVTYSDGSTSSFLIEGEIAGRSIGPYYTTKIDNVQKATEIKLGKGVTSIGMNTFYNCISLKSVTIPEGVISIGNYAFYNCYKLTSITIPETVTTIGDGAFYECGSLTSITIPSSVTSIGAIAFIWCPVLNLITFEGKTQSQVKAMSNYDWSLTSGKRISCTDGSFYTT